MGFFVTVRACAPISWHSICSWVSSSSMASAGTPKPDARPVPATQARMGIAVAQLKTSYDFNLI